MIRILLNDEIYTENYVNWNEITDTLSRSTEYYGVMISQTLSVELIGDAYKAIKYIEDNDDIAAICSIKRQRFDSIDGWITDFEGYVDFTTTEYNTRHTQVENNVSKSVINTVTLSAYSSNFSNDILERSDIKIPYDRLETLDGETITPFTNEYYEVDINGIELTSNNIFTLSAINYGLAANIIYPQINNSSTLSEWISTVTKKADGLGGGFVAPSLDWIEERVFFKPLNTTGNISGEITVTLVNAAQSNNAFRIFDYNNSLTPIYVAGDSGILSELDGTNTYTISLNYDFDNNTNLVLYLGSSSSINEIVETVSDVKVIDINNNTPCNFVPPFELGQRIIESYTGQTNGLDSPFFGRTDSPVTYDEDGEGSLFFFTNGKLIRQFPIGYTTEDSNKVSQLTFSFNDWFNSLDKVFCLGAGVKYEDGQYKLYVDDRKEFFKDEIIFELDKSDIELDTFEKVKNLDLFYSEIEIGSTYEQPEEVSGLEEYNSKQNYSSPVRNENKLDLLCPSIYAAYPFEFARRKPYNAEETTDYKYDNNNFIFNVERNGLDYQQLSETDFDEVNGLENITNYINLNITPKRNLDRFGWWINSGFKGYQSSYLKYNKSDIVTDLSTRKIDEANVIVENADVLISDLESPKLTGRIVRFSGALTPDNFKLAQNNPYGLISYPDLITGVQGYGYIKELSTNIVDKKTNYELWETVGFVEGENYRLLQDGSYRLLEDGGIRLLED